MEKKLKLCTKCKEPMPSLTNDKICHVCRKDLFLATSPAYSLGDFLHARRNQGWEHTLHNR